MERLWTDTDAATEKEMIRLLREASVSERFELADTLTSTVIALSRRAIARNRPHTAETDILLEWVRLNYGQELAQELRDYVRERRLGGQK